MAGDTRDVTVTFGDGTNHVYQNVPKNVSPDQIEQRATRENQGKKVTNISGGSPVQTTAPVQDTNKNTAAYVKPSERVKAVGEEAATGVVFGAFAPELLTAAGGLAAAFPVTAPAAPFLMEAGMAARGARIGGAALGAISGATGETAGQIAESKYGPGTKAELARLVGATFGPAPVEYLGTKAGKAIGTVLSGFGVPGMGAAKTVGALLQDAGVDAASLSAEQKAFIQKKLEEVRGGKDSLEAQKEVYQMLKGGAENILSLTEQNAQLLESEARGTILQAESRAGRIDEQTAQRINNLQSQLNSAADKIRSEAQIKAKKSIDESKKLADQITKQGENATDATKALQKIEADRILARGQKEADDLIKKANAQELRLRNYRDKVINITKGYSNTPQQAISAVGTADLPTDRGNIIRIGFENVLNGLKETRQKVIDKMQKPVFDAALEKEKSGQRVEQTQAFENALNKIDAMITNPKTGLSDISVGEVKNALTRAKSYLDPRTELDGVIIGKPVSFQGLETVRRYLRDRASGLPSEGYDAISQQQAGLVADEVEKIMEEFSPGFLAYKNAYRDASVPINQFRTKLGKAVTGKPEGFDIGDYIKDAATLGKAAFSTRGSVEQLINTLGPTQAETLARGYAADTLRNPTSKSVQSFLDSNRDWIGAFPKLQDDLLAAVRAIEKSERIGAKGGKLEQTLNVKIGAVPSGLKTEARRAEEGATREAQAAIQKGETEAERAERQARATATQVAVKGESEAGKITSEAEKDIERSAGKVEKQAGKLESEAEAQKKDIIKAGEQEAAPLSKRAEEVRKKGQEDANLILSNTTAPSRVRDIILGKNAAEWEATSKILLETPGGKEKFADAVSQVIADRATKSLKGAIEDMKYVGDNLITYGLMTPEQVAGIQSKLQEIFVMPVSNAQKMSMAQKLVRNAIVGYVAVVPPRVAGNITK